MKNIYSNIFSFNKKILSKSVVSLKRGNVLGLPTETVYGLAGNAYLKKSVNKIYKLKSKIFKKVHNKFIPTSKFLYFASGISIKKRNKNYIEFEKNKWIKMNDTKKINHHESNFIKILKLNK